MGFRVVIRFRDLGVLGLGFRYQGLGIIRPRDCGLVEGF